MLEKTKTDTDNETKTNPENQAKQIYDDRIRNFLNAVCNIVVYDLNYDKNFKAIESVLNQLKKDKVFSKAIEDNAKILYTKIVEDINKIRNENKRDESIIYRQYMQAIVLNLSIFEFLLFVSFFLPKKQRDQLQNTLLKQYYEKKQFACKIPTPLQKYLSDDLKKIINSKDNQQINTESNSDMDHYGNNHANNYKIETISHNDDDDEFNNDKKLQKLYIKLLKAIRDDIALGDDAIYKEKKQDLLRLNNNFVEEMGDIQETYKSMPGWLRSELRIGFLDNLTIRGKCVI